jgi:hypothetical protein
MIEVRIVLLYIIPDFESPQLAVTFSTLNCHHPNGILWSLYAIATKQTSPEQDKNFNAHQTHNDCDLDFGV